MTDATGNLRRSTRGSGSQSEYFCLENRKHPVTQKRKAVAVNDQHHVGDRDVESKRLPSRILVLKYRKAESSHSKLPVYHDTRSMICLEPTATLNYVDSCLPSERQSKISMNPAAAEHELVGNGVIDLTQEAMDPQSNPNFSRTDDTLSEMIKQTEDFLASVKRNAITYRDLTKDLNAKLQTIEKELSESVTAFAEEITNLRTGIKARDDEIAKLRGENDEMRKDRDDRARLEQKMMEFESTIERQATQVKQLEDWKRQMRRMLAGGDSEL